MRQDVQVRARNGRVAAALSGAASILGVLAGLSFSQAAPPSSARDRGDAGQPRRNRVTIVAANTAPAQVPWRHRAQNLPRFTSAASGTPAAFERWSSGQSAPQDLYNEELRDLRWAPAMEEALRARFAPEQLDRAGVRGLQVAELQCRQSICKVAFEYPKSLRRELQAAGLDLNQGPVDQLLARTGRLAAMATVIESQPSFLLPDGTAGERITGLVAFSKDEIDPARYGQWAQHEMARAQAQSGAGK